MKKVTIDPITRLEGHGKIEIFLNESGGVENAYLQIPELRGFEKFSEGMVDSVRKQGFQVSELTHSRSEQPFHGAYRFRATLRSSDRAADRLVGVAGTRGGLYAAAAVLAGEADEPLFGRFVESIHLLRPIPTFPTLTIGAMVADAALVTLACWAAVGLFRRSASSPFAPALVTLCGCMVVLYVALAARGVVVGARTPDELDYTLGQVAGASAVIAATTGLACRRIRDRQ